MPKFSVRLSALFLAMAASFASPVTWVVKSFVEDVRRINAGEMRDGFGDGWRERSVVSGGRCEIDVKT